LVTEYIEVDGETPSSASAGCTKLLAITPLTVSALTVYRLCQGREGQGRDAMRDAISLIRDAMRDAIREAP